MRVLHVIVSGDAPRERADILRVGRRVDGDSDLAFSASARLIEDSGRGHVEQVEHVVAVVGPASARERAAACGLRVDAVIPGVPSRARLLARWIRGSGGVSVAHAWSLDGAALAARAIELSEDGLVRGAQADAPSAPGVDGSSARVTLYRLDAPGLRGRVGGPASLARIVHMAADPGPRIARRLDHDDRLRVRERLGLKDEKFDDAPLAVLLGDSDANSDAVRFCSALSLAFHSGRRVAGVVPARCGQVVRAVAMHRRMRDLWPLAISDAPAGLLVEAADVGIFTGARDSNAEAPGASWDGQRLWERAAMEAGVARVVPRHPWEKGDGLERALAATPPELGRVLLGALASVRAGQTNAQTNAQIKVESEPDDAFARQCVGLWRMACGSQGLPDGARESVA